MHIPWIAIIGPIILVWIASFIVYQSRLGVIASRFFRARSKSSLKNL